MDLTQEHLMRDNPCRISPTYCLGRIFMDVFVGLIQIKRAHSIKMPLISIICPGTYSHSQCVNFKLKCGK